MADMNSLIDTIERRSPGLLGRARWWIVLSKREGLRGLRARFRPACNPIFPGLKGSVSQSRVNGSNLLVLDDTEFVAEL